MQPVPSSRHCSCVRKWGVKVGKAGASQTWMSAQLQALLLLGVVGCG